MTIARIVRVGAAVVAAVLLSTAAAANAPAGRYVSSGGTVYDTKTKLTWQQPVPTTTLYTWADAKTYCASASVSLALGGTGWRLPTIKELQSLVDDPQGIDSQFFPGTSSSGTFWSSTPLAGTGSPPTDAWCVVFHGGSTLYSPVTAAHFVRCVR